MRSRSDFAEGCAGAGGAPSSSPCSCRQSCGSSILRYLPIGYLAALSLQNTLGRPLDVRRAGATTRRRSRTTCSERPSSTPSSTRSCSCASRSRWPCSIAVGIDSHQEQVRARDTILTLYFMPLVTSTVASAVVFVFLYHPAYGLFNFVLGSLGLPTLTYLQDPSTALPSVAVMDIWKTLGFPVIILLAGLQTISPRALRRRLGRRRRCLGAASSHHPPAAAADAGPRPRHAGHRDAPDVRTRSTR